MSTDTDTVEMTCAPAEGILAVSGETVAALDRLAATLTGHQHWQIDISVGWTPANTIHLTARPAHTEQENR